MAAEAPLKKESGKDGPEVKSAQAEKAGRDRLIERLNAITDEAQQAVNENAQRANGFLGRLRQIFHRVGKPIEGEEALKKNAEAGEKTLEELKKALGTKTEEAVVREEEREKLFKRLAGKESQKMVGELFAYREKIAEADEHGQIGDVQFDENRGMITVNYANGDSLRKFPSGLVLLVRDNGEIERLEGQFAKKKPAPVPAKAEAAPASSETEKLAPIIDIEGTLQAIDAAKTPAQFRAYLMDNRQFLSRMKKTPEELARMPDADLEKARLELKDEIDGGIRAWQAEFDAAQSEGDGVQEAIDRGVEDVALEEDLKEGSAFNPIALTADMKKTVKTASGEIEALPKPNFIHTEDSVIVDEGALKMKIITSESSPTAAGVIGGAKDEKPAMPPREAYPDLPVPEPGSRPPGVPDARSPQTTELQPEAAPAPDDVKDEAGEKIGQNESAEPSSAAEKKESALERVEASIPAAAAEALKMPEASESPKTFPSKVRKMSAEKMLKLFVGIGTVSESEAKALAMNFKLQSETFTELRKKLAEAVAARLKA